MTHSYQDRNQLLFFSLNIVLIENCNHFWGFFSMTAWYLPVFDMGHHTVFLVCEKFNLDFEKGFGESDWVTNRKKITEEERWKGEGRVQRRKRKCTRKWNEKTCDETPLINQIIWEPLLPQQHFTNARTQRILVLNMVLIFLYSSYSYNFMIIPTWGNTCLPTLFIWF